MSPGNTSPGNRKMTDDMSPPGSPEGTPPKSSPYATPSNYERPPKGNEDSIDRYDRDKGPPNQPKLESPRRRKIKTRKKKK